MQLFVVASVVLGVAFGTPLDDYVNKYDPTYRYEETNITFRGDGYTSYYINMTSQTWLSASEVTRSVWWHYLVITIPDKVQYTDTGFIYITGGSNDDQSPPDLFSGDGIFSPIVAYSTGTVTATLFQIPNAPIVFTDDPTHKSRTEDAIIAFTWYHFLNNPDDPEYLLRLPMTKAAVRALDTMASFAASKNPAFNLTKFVVAGASKRGWTTWTTGAVDPRVIGIVPIVMDELNMQANLHHHFRAYGGWSFAFNDYYELNITQSLDDPNMKTMAAIIDPISYVDRLVMPKLIIHTGGDEFFLPDDSYYFWDALQGDKYIRTLPNAEHSCAGHVMSLILDARAFYLSILLGASRPVMKWSLNQTSDGGYITLDTDRKPSTVYLYVATTLSSERRDFRLFCGIPDPNKPTPQPVFWFSYPVDPQPSGQYVAKVDNPLKGWRAFFLQATFPGPQDSVYEFTTQVNIIPNTFPYPDCSGRSCLGKLL
ncbi:hypothetical protein EMCRGX_G013313 [Ephydatia muelleri]|eukprot:Em0004g977a